jgi:hypothetical protein
VFSSRVNTVWGFCLENKICGLEWIFCRRKSIFWQAHKKWNKKVVEKSKRVLYGASVFEQNLISAPRGIIRSGICDLHRECEERTVVRFRLHDVAICGHRQAETQR